MLDVVVWVGYPAGVCQGSTETGFELGVLWNVCLVLFVVFGNAHKFCEWCTVVVNVRGDGHILQQWHRVYIDKICSLAYRHDI